MHLFSRYIIPRAVLRAVLPLLLIAAAPVAAQISVYPDVLYTGMNHISFRAANGLAKIEWRHMGEWKPIVTGTNTSLYRVITSPGFGRCAKQATSLILVKNMRPAVTLRFRVTDCDGESEVLEVETDQIWNVYREDFGKVKIGQTVCKPFEVLSDNGTYVVESVQS